MSRRNDHSVLGKGEEMKSAYGRVTHQTIEKLTAIIGKDSIITDRDELEGYSCDETPLSKPHAPNIAVKPADSHTIAELLEFLIFNS